MEKFISLLFFSEKMCYIKLSIVLKKVGIYMERRIGTVSRGVRCPIIREGDNLVDIVVNSVIEAADSEGFELRNRDVVGITESIVARAQGNYVSVEDIAADVKAKTGGETVGIIGGTGSGKSSLVNMIPRFYEASSGRVCVDGIDVNCYNLPDLREKIGMVMQKAVLFKGTIRDNLKWRKEDATDEELLCAMQTAQASEILAGKDGGLDYFIEQNGRNLSGGQKQRLTIARALVGRPDILILDDSASALDFATDARLRQALRALPYQATVFIVSQRVSSIRHADKIVVLDDGKMAAIGTHDELLKTCGIYKEIFQSQGGVDA